MTFGEQSGQPSKNTETRYRFIFKFNNLHNLWEGLHTVTDFKGNSGCIANVTTPLPDKLNDFSDHFKGHNTPKKCIKDVYGGMTPSPSKRVNSPIFYHIGKQNHKHL